MAIMFSKLLKKTDIKKRLSVPTKSLRSLGVNRRGMDLHVIDASGKLWRFRCLIRKKEKYLKPVLSKGWLAFVRANKLRIGDRVTFHEELGQASAGGLHQYKIQVEKKPVKIFGVVFGYI